MSLLAIRGGKPVREHFLSYGKQSIDETDIQAVIDTLKGDFLTTGPMVEAFEKKVSDYVGAKYAVAVSNGTAALHMACHSAGIGPGDEVIVSAMTFAASSNCVLYQGATPVFADIDIETYNVTPDEIEKKITNKTKAIIPVDFTGQSVDMDGIMALAKKNNLIVIEDGAHALGSEYKGKKVGSSADMTEFSFHPVKPITTGEGGVVTTNDEKLYRKMRQFRTHGITRDLSDLIENEGPWYYEQQELGFNYRLTDIQCSLGLSQMNRIDEFIERRRNIVALYNDAFKDNPLLEIPYEEEYSRSGYHIYVIRLNLDQLKVGRREVFDALRAENIGVNVHYIPPYYHPYYKELGYSKGLCPNAERLYEEIITLPLFPEMTKKDVMDVITATEKVLNFYKR